MMTTRAALHGAWRCKHPIGSCRDLLCVSSSGVAPQHTCTHGPPQAPSSSVGVTVGVGVDAHCLWLQARPKKKFSSPPATRAAQPLAPPPVATSRSRHTCYKGGLGATSGCCSGVPLRGQVSCPLLFLARDADGQRPPGPPSRAQPPSRSTHALDDRPSVPPHTLPAPPLSIFTPATAVGGSLTRATLNSRDPSTPPAHPATSRPQQHAMAFSAGEVGRGGARYEECTDGPPAPLTGAALLGADVPWWRR